MRGGWVYIVTNRPNGTLYAGVTSGVGRRAYEHRRVRNARRYSIHHQTLGPLVAF